MSFPLKSKVSKNPKWFKQSLRLHQKRTKYFCISALKRSQYWEISGLAICQNSANTPSLYQHSGQKPKTIFVCILMQTSTLLKPIRFFIDLYFLVIPTGLFYLGKSQESLILEPGVYKGSGIKNIKIKQVQKYWNYQDPSYFQCYSYLEVFFHIGKTTVSKNLWQKLIIFTCKIIAPGHRRQPNHFSNFTLCIGWKKAFRLSVSISFSAVFKMNMLDLANLLDNDGNMQNEMMVMAFAATLMSTIPVLLGNEFDVNVGKFIL